MGLQTGQVWSRSGSELKFNSFELDSEVGRLVLVLICVLIKTSEGADSVLFVCVSVVCA